MKRLLLPLLLALTPALPAAAQEAPSTAVRASEPLVILRFGQRNLYFEKALGNAVRAAQKVKPDVTFRAVLIPGVRNESDDGNLDRVARSLQNMGVPQSRILAERASPAGKGGDEVHVFVQ